MMPGLRHEPHRVDVTALYRWSLRLAVCVIGVVALMYLLWRHVAPEALPVPTSPPGPKLQAHALQDRARIQATQRARLEEYRWLDREHRMAEVPVERAMEIAASRAAHKDEVGEP
ncbi:MAG TPA: hypothetical protein VIM98_09405 [Dyella sp.]|uniref:hypothetical protein n=1 Tax=Dyella sp. TaxID=1869338 RepID=UPI002F95EB77